MKLFLAAALAILWSPSARADSGISCPAVSTTETPAIQLALALQDRIRASDPAARKESELRLSAALDRSGLIRAAHSGYRVVLGSNEATPSDRARALACMNRIEKADPALSRLEDSSILRGVATREFPARSEAGEFLFRQFTLALREAPRRADELASLLESALPGSLEAALARSFLLAREKKPLEALRMLTPLLASDRWPASLERHRNAGRVLAARSAFAIGQPLEAARLLRTVDKSANLAPAALEELSWALLEGERPGEAIGTALQLERGLLARTFAPEAPMVLAMSLNELCQFPSALAAISRFKRRWQTVHQWFEDDRRRPAALLPRTRRILKKEKETGIPAMVAWELIQAPQYLAQESFIATLTSESRLFEALASGIRSEKLRLAQKIVESSRDLTTRIVREGAPLSGATEADLRRLRQELLQYRALRRASGPARRMAANFSASRPGLRRQAEAGIEADLRRRARRMALRLDEVIENLGLVEIEILDGASRDLVWQNAHPELARKAQEQVRARGREKSWDWGSAFTLMDSRDGAESEEIWEDELGSHEVLITDRCALRERQVALQGESP